ncbi:MAG: EAL domain-containing protein [Lachnospiraceae bacterium]|nr:EAL domain-containing protein [Lachnospiraceae bacterium]
MRLLLGTILTITLFVIGHYIFKTHNKIKETDTMIAHDVAWILKIGFIIVLFNIINLFIPSKFPSLIAYSVYFILSNWLLYFLLKFSVEFIGSRFEKHVNRGLMIAVLMVDSVSVALNTCFLHMFDLIPVKWFGDCFFNVKLKPLFYVHYGISLMLVIFCFVSLFYRVFRAAAYYRKKYLMVASLLVVIVVLNIFTVDKAVDLSVFAYVLEGICIYYCVFVFTPQQLLPKSLLQVAHEMTFGIVVFDAEGAILYKNKKAEHLLDDENPYVNLYGVTLESLCRDNFYEKENSFNKQETLYRNDIPRILDIQMQMIQDDGKHLEGTYYIIKDSTEELEQLNKDKFLASHDSLTGLYNRQYFYEKTEQYINFHRNKEFLMICTDIREFKMINDFFGTKIGDQVLINFSKMLSSQLSDASIYGRIENDIFGILMTKEKYDEEKFSAMAQEAFESCIDTGISFPTINYIGVYEITDRSIPASVMCDRARMAITSIKGSFQKRVAYYNDALRDNIMYEQELITDLDHAIATGEIKMYLQPQMSSDGKMLGAEALVRWEHAEKGMIMPGNFIPVFEKNGLISEVDKHIWELACKQLCKWRSEGKEDLYISVNISPRDFYFLNIYQVFTDLVVKYDIPPHNLKLEITETAIAMDVERQLELIERLRNYGFIVEMDDFGSGYSSLNMLKDIQVDILKIDMAFLRKSKDEERSKKILHMIINLSKQLGMPVISEGVETKEQVQYLSDFGCDMFQGYYFAKPMDVAAFEKQYL